MKTGYLPNEFLSLSLEEKARRFDEMILATFSHADGRDLLQQLSPRKTLDIKRRVDGKETWFEGDWLTTLLDARNGRKISEYHNIPNFYDTRNITNLRGWTEV